METLLLTYMKGVQFPAPTPLYAALFSTDPTDANLGTEVTFSIGGTRPTITFGAITDSAGGKRIANSTDLTFTNGSTSSATITHIGVYDAPSGGNLIVHGSLTSPISLQTGYAVKVLANQFSVTVK